jgi:hypothetical protein
MFNRVIDFVRGPTFAGRADAVVAETGWRPASRTGGAVVFRLAHRGREYEFALEPAGGRMKVSAGSNGRFAPAGFPPGLERALAARNRELAEFDWQVVHGPRSSRAVLVTHARLAAVDGELVRAAAGRMLAEVALLDDGLRRVGLM